MSTHQRGKDPRLSVKIPSGIPTPCMMKSAKNAGVKGNGQNPGWRLTKNYAQSSVISIVGCWIRHSATITGLRLQDVMIVSYSNLLTVCPSHLLLLLYLITSAKKDLANDFSDFFHGKARQLHDTLDSLKWTDLSVEIHELANSSFASFSHVSTDEVQKIVTKSANKSCALDPVPTTDLLKKCLDPVLPHITRIIKMSLNTGSVPETLKVAQVIMLFLWSRSLSLIEMN